MCGGSCANDAVPTSFGCSFQQKHVSGSPRFGNIYVYKHHLCKSFPSLLPYCMCLHQLCLVQSSREQELFPGNVVHSVDFLSSIIGLQKLKTKFDQRREDRNRSQGRYKSKERVRGTPSSLDPPPNPVKWAVKGSSPHLSQPSSVVNTSSSSAPNTPSLSALNTLPLF